MSEKMIYLSPSSQTENRYIHDNSISEAYVCRQIALMVLQKLKSLGLSKIRLAESNLTVAGRIKDSNNYLTNVHLCIHTNAGNGNGTEVYCYPGNKENVIVKSLYEEVGKVLGRKNGIRDNTSFAEIKKTSSLCVYMELEYHDHKTYAPLIVSHIEPYAEAITRGLLKGLYSLYPSDYERAWNWYNGLDTEPKTLYTVQCGAFKNRENAVALEGRLKDYGFDCFITEKEV